MEVKAESQPRLMMCKKGGGDRLGQSHEQCGNRHGAQSSGNKVTRTVFENQGHSESESV